MSFKKYAVHLLLLVLTIMTVRRRDWRL